MSKKQIHLQNLILTAILAALSVVLGRFFSYNVQDFSIGFGFLPVLICGMLCGVWWGGICGALADLLGALLFPFGAYFPGFTAVAFLMGAMYGAVGACERKLGTGKLFFASSAIILLLTEAVGTLALNSLWLHLMYGRPYVAQLVLRLPQAIAYFIVKTAAAIIIAKLLLPIAKKSFKRS